MRKLKDPQEALDYVFDFTDDLTTGETLTTRTVTVTSGLTLDSDSLSTPKVTAKLSGGAVGDRHTVKCLVTTSGGRTFVRRLGIRIINR